MAILYYVVTRIPYSYTVQRSYLGVITLLDYVNNILTVLGSSEMGIVVVGGCGPCPNIFIFEKLATMQMSRYT